MLENLSWLPTLPDISWIDGRSDKWIHGVNVYEDLVNFYVAILHQLSLWVCDDCLPFVQYMNIKLFFFSFSSTSFSCYFRPFQYKDCNEKLKCCPVPKVSLGGLCVSVWIWKCASVKCQLSNCKCENTALSFHQSHCVVIVILSCYWRCFHPHTAVQKWL